MLGYYSIALIMSFIFLFQIAYSENILNLNKIDYDQLMSKYWSWWVDVPLDERNKGPCVIHFEQEGSFVFFKNPYFSDNVIFDCQAYPIAKKSIISFPIITGFCSDRDKGLVGADISKILECAYFLDRGSIKAKVWIDGKLISTVDKTNLVYPNVATKRFLDNKTLDNVVQDHGVYKELVTTNFVDIKVDNLNSPYTFEKFDKPFTASAAMHYEGIIINASELSEGSHTIDLWTKAFAKKEAKLDDEGWNYERSIKYKILVGDKQ